MAGKKHSPEQVIRKLREAEAEPAARQRVGINRPDVQYTDPVTRQRIYVEYEKPNQRGRGQSHAQRILANDPGAKVIVEFIPRSTNDCTTSTPANWRQ